MSDAMDTDLPAATAAPQSSPLFFPGSSPAKGTPGVPAPAAAASSLGSAGRRLMSNIGRSSSPLAFGNSSSPAMLNGAARPPASQRTASSEPLFFPPSENSPTPRRAPNARGDIHSSRPPSTPGNDHTPRRRAHNVPTSALGQSSDLNRHAASLSNGDAPMSDHEGPRRVLWGTTVGMAEAMAAFRTFLTEYKVKYRVAYDRQHGHRVSEEDEANGGKLLYEHYLRIMRTTGQTNLNLDMINLAAFPPTRKLDRWLRNYPQEIVPICDQVLKDVIIDLAQADMDRLVANEADRVTEEDIDEMEGRVYKIRPFASVEKGRMNAQQAKETGQEDADTIGVNMRDLSPADIDKLVTIKGLVIRATPIIPDMKTAFFRCLGCSHTLTVDNDRGRIAEPEKCPRDVCSLKGSMTLVHNRCDFADRQVIRLQETPDAVPDGQTPHTVSLCAYDELVDSCKPGDRIRVTGIFRSVPVRVNPRQRTIKSLFKTYLDVLHVQKTDSKRLGTDKTTTNERSVGVGGDERTELESDRRAEHVEAEARLIALSQRPDLYELLARSLAPSIWEMDDVKKGILLQLFGGTNKTISRGGGAGGPRYRGDINVLLVGDPGTSKSQILQYVHKIAPRGVYTSGKGSSAVGLTAYVTRDPDSKQLVLESGALVLSDGGVCCIDEFDKMSHVTRSVLHEVMEQQTVSVAKAGIITTLNARTSILAAANPVGSKYNLNWPITRNIDLPPTLISRFDLLYLVLDKIDEDNDRRLARHLVGLYLEDRAYSGNASEILPIETLTAYISYARQNAQPEITSAASELLVSNYVTMRQAGFDARSSERRITATTRQLESMIRLSEARARLRLSPTVDADDVAEAARLIREALRESATDPVTGLIDVDLLNIGQGQQGRRLQGDLKRELLGILDGPKGPSMRWADVFKMLESQSSIAVDKTGDFASAVRELELEGVLKVVGSGDKRVIRKQA